MKHCVVAKTRVVAIAVSVVSAVLATPSLRAQSSAAQASSPAFEVASVKPNTSNAPRTLAFRWALGTRPFPEVSSPHLLPDPDARVQHTDYEGVAIDTRRWIVIDILLL